MRTLRQAVNVSPAWAVVVSALALIAAAAQAGVMLNLGALTDGILTRTGWGSSATWMIACLLAGAVAEAGVRFGVASWQASFIRRGYERFGTVIFSNAGSALLRAPDTAKKIEGVRSSIDHWMFRDALESMVSIAATWLLGLSALVVLAQWRWWAGMLCGLAFLLSSWTIARWSGTVDDELDGATGDDVRRATYLRTLLTGPGAATELRVFGLAPHLLRRWRNEWERANRAVLRHRREALRPVVASTALLVLAVGATIAFVIYDAVSGSLPAGQVVTVMSALLGLTAFGYQGDVMLSVRHTDGALRDLTLLERDACVDGDEICGAGHSQVAVFGAFDVRGSAGWNEETTVLHDLDIRLDPGTTTALVGENGAGKSTVAALATGEIQARGHRATVREGPVAAVLQSFARFPLTLRENVVMGKPFELDLYERIMNEVGLGGLISGSPDADTTPLGEDGRSLSGGEWQKVALARALYQLRGGPGLLVLDEPSAALDLESESRLFSDVRQYTGTATVLMATHRLGSVRSADHIVVLQAGRVVEVGSHSALMDAAGHYAALAQAKSKLTFDASVPQDAARIGDAREDTSP